MPSLQADETENYSGREAWASTEELSISWSVCPSRVVTCDSERMKSEGRTAMAPKSKRKREFDNLSSD
jgi:hypothetical protein